MPERFDQRRYPPFLGHVETAKVGARSAGLNMIICAHSRKFVRCGAGLPVYSICIVDFS